MLKILLIISTVFVLLNSSSLFGQNIKAYYTNLGDNYEALDMDQEKIFGKYADLVVDLGKGKNVLFSRMTSYLPVFQIGSRSWKFDEMIERSGDGNSDRPDVLSRYSHVRLITAKPEHVTVHWRYFPDFKYVEWDGVVDEYFTFFPSGLVSRKIKKGTRSIDEWNNESNLIEASYTLNDSGITLISQSNIPIPNSNNKAINPDTYYQTQKEDLLLSISFNQREALESDKVVEEVSKELHDVVGHKTLIKNGIIGSALHFDGYSSAINLPSIDYTKIDQITIESFIALGAYPFGNAPIVHQAIWNKNGFYLGIDENGFPHFNIGTETEWISITSEQKLEINEWYHISASFNRHAGELNLYVNGELVAAHTEIKNSISLPDKELVIGMNSQKMPDIEGRIRRGKWPSMFGVDGLIDEMRIYRRALTRDQIVKSFKELNLAEDQLNNPDMMIRNMPINPNNKKAEKFGAEYAHLKYYETWDNLWRVGDHPDVVVSFDEIPAKIASWRGTSYGPYFVTENGKWIGDQSNEDYRLIEHPGDAEGCLEHMSDKQCRHSHIRIIENTDARVVLHWRYGLVDSRYLFAPRNEGWGGWTDEYWTIYPDGVAIRDVARGIVFGDGWVETMFLSSPGTKPEDNVELEAITILSEDDDIRTLSWAEDSPEGVFEDVLATIVNSKSTYKMFNVYPTGSSIEVFGGHSKHSKFHWWNHWPVSQITSDGRGARAADRIAHSSLVWGAPSKNILMYGITDKTIENLKDLANSWNHPPKIVSSLNQQEIPYDQNQRAYIIKNQKELDFSISAARSSPLYNPCFIVNDWGSDKHAQLYINGEKRLSGEDIRQGIVFGAEGEYILIVWVKGKFHEKTAIKIE